MFSVDGKHEAALTVRPEPVLDEVKAGAKVTSVITAAAGLAVTLGFITADAAAPLIAAATAVGTGGLVLVNYYLSMKRAYAAREKVTPVADPQLGAPLA